MFDDLSNALDADADDGGEEAARNVASELAVELVSVVDEDDSNRTRAKWMRVARGARGEMRRGARGDGARQGAGGGVEGRGGMARSTREGRARGQGRDVTERRKKLKRENKKQT